MTYLAGMTKAATKVNEMMDLYETIRDRGRGGPRGMMRRYMQ